MTDNIENLVLEHLRAVRAKIDQLADETYGKSSTGW